MAKKNHSTKGESAKYAKESVSNMTAELKIPRPLGERKMKETEAGSTDYLPQKMSLLIITEAQKFSFLRVLWV